MVFKTSDTPETNTKQTPSPESLVLAAPDMLEALRIVESCFSPEDNDYAARKVRAAIAKALGQ